MPLVQPLVCDCPGCAAGLPPFTLEHFMLWAGELELDSGDRWRVEPFQQAPLRDLFGGTKVLWFVVPTGNGKTTFTAGLSLYFLEHVRDARIPVAAAAKEQADELFAQAEGFVMRSPRLSQQMPHVEKERKGKRTSLMVPRFSCQDGVRMIRFYAGGKLQIRASEERTADGAIPRGLAVIDELHRQRNLGLYRTWRDKLGKTGARLVVISTAGEPGSEFEEAREKIKASAVEFQRDGSHVRARSSSGIVLHDWQVPESADENDLEVVKRANPLAAITLERLRERLEDPTMTERHWRRFTCNQPTLNEGRDVFLASDDWKALGVTGVSVTDGDLVCLGADGSRAWDTTVVAWASRSADGMVTVDAHVFSVRPDIAAHTLHRGGKIDFDDVEEFIVDRFDRFSVFSAAYDPRYLERSMDLVDARLPDARVVAVEPSSKSMRDALQAMFTLAAEGKLRHSGDPVLAAHVANAGVDRGYGSEIRRVRKIDARLPIDAVPAMALAVWRAAEDLAKKRTLAASW